VSVPVLDGLGPDGEPGTAVAERVARAWLAGGLVGLPTETVYGLAADAEDPAAVARIYAAKGRPADHPLIVHVADSHALDGWSAVPDPRAHALAVAFWPGPLTLVVRRGPRAGDHVTGGQSTVALRCPAHPVAHACLAALTRLAGDPARGVAAPSANRFGRVSPTRAVDVLAELGDRLDADRDLVVDGGPSEVGVESTIVDCTAPRPRVLRHGAVSQQQVDAVLARAGLLPEEPPAQGPPGLVSAGTPAVGAPGAPAPASPGLPPEVPVRAPGTLDSHYSPRARVVLTSGDPSRLGDDEGAGPVWQRGGGVGLLADVAVPTPSDWVRLAAPTSAAEYAHCLYAALRRADDLGLATIVAVPPDLSAGPLAEAVADRLRRAAHRG
jgi:L-threonylcarbamoyladenylate synthase